MSFPRYLEYKDSGRNAVAAILDDALPNHISSTSS